MLQNILCSSTFNATEKHVTSEGFENAGSRANDNKNVILTSQN